MFLKSLTLKGFKSFADTTTLHFEPGITVVVGPNGSGKSNVVDAVAWVLGAQGPRTVRSAKMEDVIFAGSANRTALGRAEVSLTIDNSDGLLAIGFTEVTLTRTLFRSGDSTYAINGAPCRLLDVQELLSDSGVGRQQHVIVSQGQIDAVLNSRAEERRSVIEEAAGVLKFRRRRERAQRRLDATEANYVRLQDLLREVRRQLRPLERQADSARRHGSLTAELSALRLHLAGREIASLRQRAEAATGVKRDLSAAEADFKVRLSGMDDAVASTEATLSLGGGLEQSEALMRAERLRERGRGLSAVLAERARGIERDRASSVDQGVIASLEADHARLASELEEVDHAADLLLPRHDALQEAEAALVATRVAFADQWGDGSTPPAPSEGAEVRGELAALRGSAERGAAELGRSQARQQALGDRVVRLSAESERLAEEVAAAQETESPLSGDVGGSVARRAAAESELSAAEGALRSADADLHAWRARVDALASALDEARARAGAERLSEIDGVVGTLLDLVEVDDGWQNAFEAAAGEAIAAVVVGSVDSARQALEHLRTSGQAGSVLALGGPRRPTALPMEATAAGSPVRDHVRSSTSEVERLLDVLLANAVAVRGSWRNALDLALEHPSVVVVTRDGDRFAAGGWRAGAAGAGATGAALAEARQEVARADRSRREAEERLRRAKVEAVAAREAETAVRRAVDENRARLSAAVDARERVEAQLGDVSAEREALAHDVVDLTGRVARDQARLAELEARLPDLLAAEEARAAEASVLKTERLRLDERTAAVGALRTDLEVRAAALEERRTYLTHRLGEVGERLRGNVAKRDEAEAGRHRLDARAAATARLSELVADRLRVVETVLSARREERRRHADHLRSVTERLDGLRRERAAAERHLGELREKGQRAELDGAEVRVRLEQAVEVLRRDLDCEPHTAMATACPDLPAGTSAPTRMRELERELRLMGAINPMALEELSALQERQTFLDDQLDDVKAGRRELAKVIKAIDTEIVEVFAAAYADVSENFSLLFTTLFPGGTGRLRLTDPDNLLETGIEVEARPSGKNVRQLSLLSGGERSLTALAFLFAVFRSRPSPFYLMDEVEAALDDVNLHRFLDLIGEFRREAQLVIVSHQKRTMEAADCLYGVTMLPGGASRVISEKVTADA